ncbi:male sterility protein-domain-containing protein [Ustulina deusta]|nr:male sterility protein-domain-containing protein [Ustulina deusta]
MRRSPPYGANVVWGIPVLDARTSSPRGFHTNTSTFVYIIGLTGTAADLVELWNELIPAHAVNNNGSTIGPHVDFFHIGGTSLLLLKLRTRIQAHFGVEIRLVDLFNNSTVKGMTVLIDQKNGSESPVNEVIDWEAETRPPGMFPRVSSPHFPDIQVPPKVIVLTGATGYLGRALLHALIEEAHIEKIYCIGIRNIEEHRSTLGFKKVVLHEGDLNQPRIGLGERTAREIFASADLVIHNGADVSYLKSYDTLRLSNVQSTSQLTTLCLPRRIPFHFISSGGVCSFAAGAGRSSIGPQSLIAYPPPVQWAPGYLSSKWASEVLLERLVKACSPGWTVWIHRPSNIARIDEPQLDLVYNLRHYCRMMKAVPDTRGKVSGSLDSVPLSYVVRGIIDVVMNGVVVERDDGANPEEKFASKDRKEHGREIGVRFTHHLGGKLLRLDDLRTWATEDDGDIEVLPLKEWVARAEALGMHPAAAAMLAGFGTETVMAFPALSKDTPSEEPPRQRSAGREI